MLKRFVLLLLGALLLIPGAQAQENWSIFLYNSIERQLLRINGVDGTQQSFDLALSQETYLGGQAIAITGDGSRVAFCANSPQETTLVVRDLATATNQLAIRLGQSIGCQLSQASLSPDENILVVSIVYYYPGDPNANAGFPTWSLQGFNVASGSIMFELNSESPLAASAGMLIDSALLPQVRYFDGNEIIFAEVPFGVGGAPDYRAFRWQPAAGILELDTTGRWGKSGLSTLAATGEMVWLDYDPALPALDPNSPLPALNVALWADVGGEQRLIHHTPDWLLADTAFINDGADLALLYIAAMDMDNPQGPELRWMALDRQGNLRQLASGAAFSQIANAPGGHVLFEVFQGENPTESRFRLSHNDQTLWEMTGMGWELVGTTATPSGADLPPFPAVSSG